MQTHEVIVIGTMLAGLAAADILREAALEVLVLEVRQHVGGRVYTLRELHAEQYAEAGAEFIDLDHRLMASYMRRFGLTHGLELRPYDRAIFAGRVISYGNARRAELPDAITRLLSSPNFFSADLRQHYFRPYWEQ